MSQPQHIWLIRHGETAWSRTGQHTGREDLDLLPETMPMLDALRPPISAQTFGHVFSSPLRRARQTAERIGLSKYELDDNLMEWDYGSFNGKTKQQICSQHPQWNLWRDGVPGGETLEAVAERAQKVIARVEALTGDVALISHGHLLRILAACWQKLPPQQAEHMKLRTGAICILARQPDHAHVVKWNWKPDSAPISA